MEKLVVGIGCKLEVGDVLKMNFSVGVNMYRLNVTSY
jgi:hypothetical protein